MNINKNIPNFFTCMNLLSGCLAIVFASKQYFSLSLNFVIIAAAFDFIDGLSARILNVSSEFGKQLDSLSDIVSFGIAPSFILFQFMTENKSYLPANALNDILPYFSFMIAIFSALRLARFNLETHAGDYFIGLPTPANGLFISSIPFVKYHCPSIVDLSIQFKYLFSNNYFLLIIIVLFSYLLVSRIKLFSLKFKNIAWVENQWQYLFFIFTIVLIILFSLQAMPLIIFIYLGMSLIQNMIIEKI